MPWLPGGPPATEPTVLAHAAGHDGLAWLRDHAEGYARLLIPAVLGPDGSLSQTLLQQIAAERSRTVPDIQDFDGTLPGWGWTRDGTAWVVPTAMAALSLGRSRHPAYEDATALLRDRRCADGGWNYGNPRALGTPLPAQAEPTAWALLALGPAAQQAATALGGVEDQPMGTAVTALMLLAAARCGQPIEPWWHRLDRRIVRVGFPTRCDHLAWVALAARRHEGAPCPFTGVS